MLLRLLYDQVSKQPRIQCRVHWEPGTLMLWDNRCMLHRAEGFDDRAIHDAVQVIALFAYYNRVAEGLGVRVSDDPQ